MFVAQIDWRDIAAALGSASFGLPESGALAFFLGVGWAVIAVPPGAHSPTEAPADAPVAFENGGALLPQDSDPSLGPKSFPYWPATLAPPDPEPKGRYFLGVRQLYQKLGDAPRPYWRHTAVHIAASLRTGRTYAYRRLEKARRELEAANANLQAARPPWTVSSLWRKPSPTPAHAKAEQRLAAARAEADKAEQQILELEALTLDSEQRAAGDDEWAPITEGEAEQLRDLHTRARKSAAKAWLPYSFEDLESLTIIALASAPDQAYRTMPEALRRAINEEYLRPPQYPHQMFGEGVDIQGNAALENEGNHMLLQLSYDDMLFWQFGDMGAFQFWISPADLESQNWGGVRMTFECS